MYVYNYYNNLFYIYIYIVITLTKMPHLTHNLFRLQSRLSFLSSTHSPLPLSLTLLSCLSRRQPLSCSQPLGLTLFAEEDEDKILRFSPQRFLVSLSHLTLFAEEDEDKILRFSPQRFSVPLSHALMFFFHFFFI